MSVSNEEPSIRNEAQALDEQEAELRQMLGSELEFLVDMVQAGMVA